MNVGTLKTLAYLASAALFAGMTYIGYEFFTADLERMSRPADLSHTVDVLKSVQAPEPPRETGLDYNETIKPAVIGFDWTGAPPPPPPPPDEPTDTAEGEVVAHTPVEELVMVLGVFGIAGDATDESDSFALIALLGEGGAMARATSASNVRGRNGQQDRGNRGGGNARPSPQPGAKPGARPAAARTASVSVGAALVQGYFFVGDSLPEPNSDVSIFAIRDGGVEFSFADEERRHEFLMPPTRIASTLITTVASLDEVKRPKVDLIATVDPEAASGADAPPAQTQKRFGQYYLGTEDLDRFSRDYQGILSSDVRLEAYRDPATGEKSGVKVASVKPGSIVERHGAQEGDVILSINGQAVTSEQEALRYVRENSGATAWRVRYLRLGEEREEVYHSPSK